MKIILFKLMLIMTLSIQGQTYKAIYKVKYKDAVNRAINLDTLSDINKRAYIRMTNKKKEAVDLAEQIELVLNFNTNSSIFYIPKKLEIKKGTMNTFRRISGIRGIYYANSSKTIQQKNSYGENFLVTIPKFKWKITNESKKIGKYLCYKATTERIIKNYKGEFRRPVVAWFTTELPFNFGPKEFNGLPGLIVQLEQGRNIFYVSSIKKDKDVKIKEPKKGKRITLEEFEKLSKKMFESLKLKSNN